MLVCFHKFLKKKPRQFSPAGLLKFQPIANYLAAAFFSFAFSITASATLLGQAE